MEVLAAAVAVRIKSSPSYKRWRDGKGCLGGNVGRTGLGGEDGTPRVHLNVTAVLIGLLNRATPHCGAGLHIGRRRGCAA